MQEITLYTTRLTLRPVRETDLQLVHDLHSLPATDHYNTLGIPGNIKVTEDIIKDWIKDYSQTPPMKYVFAIELSHSNIFIGLAALKPGAAKYHRAELWYKLRPEFWNKGYATEAAKALIGFGFDALKLHRVEAGCAVDNTGSVKVLEKAGMRLEGRKRQVLPLKTGWSDGFDYAILSSDTRN